MNKFRKSKLASAMLCTLLLGGNASAMQKDVSEGISSDKLKDNLLKGQTENKELENKKPGDSSDPLLKYALYFLGIVKLADEGVGFAQAKNYIVNTKFSPLGKSSLYKFAMAKYYEAKTIGTMRNLVAESHKNAEGIGRVFDGINKFLTKYSHAIKKVLGKDNIFDVTYGKGVDIKIIFNDIKANFDFESLSNYVKAVLGVSVEECDKILVNVNQDNKYIAFVKDNVCLNLTKDNEGIICFNLCGMKNNLPDQEWPSSLTLDNRYSMTSPYVLHILGIKYVGGGDFGCYFCDKILSDIYGYIIKFQNDASKLFPDLFPKPVKVIQKFDD